MVNSRRIFECSKKKKKDGHERVKKEGTVVTNQRENVVHWKRGRLRSAVRGLVEIPSLRSMRERERERASLKNSRSNAIRLNRNSREG